MKSLTLHIKRKAGMACFERSVCTYYTPLAEEKGAQAKKTKKYGEEKKLR